MVESFHNRAYPDADLYNVSQQNSFVVNEKLHVSPSLAVGYSDWPKRIATD